LLDGGVLGAGAEPGRALELVVGTLIRPVGPTHFHPLFTGADDRGVNATRRFEAAAATCAVLHGVTARVLGVTGGGGGGCLIDCRHQDERSYGWDLGADQFLHTVFFPATDLLFRIVGSARRSNTAGTRQAALRAFHGVDSFIL